MLDDFHSTLFSRHDRVAAHMNSVTVTALLTCWNFAWPELACGGLVNTVIITDFPLQELANVTSS